jgi:hypothetical protein
LELPNIQRKVSWARSLPAAGSNSSPSVRVFT